MSERYSTLFRIPSNLHSSGSPLIIVAGALLKDYQNGKVLAQIKYKSISNKPIKAVKIELSSFDVTGEPAGDAIAYQYLDLNVKRDEEFGSKVAIPLTLETIRSYSIKITDVVYSDGSIWKASDNKEWHSIPAQKRLSEELKDKELVKQYILETSPKSEYIPTETDDLWLCSCGAINYNNEKVCGSCKCSLEKLLDNLNVTMLLEKKKKRLEEAKVAEIEKLEEAKLHEEQRKNHNKKLSIRFSLIGVIIVLLAAAFILINNNVIIPNNKYKEAMDFYNSKNYSEAITMFTDLGDYKDSAVMLNECNYQNALTFLDKKQYSSAIATFSNLGDYNESESLVTESYYAYAEECFNKGELNTAYDLYIKLPADYKNVQKRIALIEPYLSMCGKWKETETTITTSSGSINTATASVVCNVSVIFDKNNAAFLEIGSFGTFKLIGNETEKTSLASGDIGDIFYFSFYESKMYLHINYSKGSVYGNGSVCTTTYERESAS